MAKISNSIRFKHLPRFKGELFFSGKSNEPCCVLNEKQIVGMGCIMTSQGGKEFKVLFNSDEQQHYASLIQNKAGSVRLIGYYHKDNVYVTGCYYPRTKAQKRNKLHTIREKAEFEKSASDKMFTGQHRSHETYVPAILRNLEVTLDKKPEAPLSDDIWNDTPIMPKLPKKKIKKEKDDFELEKEKEKRVDELNAFKLVCIRVKNIGIKWALMDMGYTPDDIEKFQKMLGVCSKYMSHKAHQ